MLVFVPGRPFQRGHDNQHNDIQYNNIQHNDKQYKGPICYTMHNDIQNKLHSA
jgi:hypothetical protein